MAADTGQRDTAEVQGIDRESVTRWMSERIRGIEPPLRFELITGGHSNLTFRVADTSGGRWVLRRPPLGQVLATAHDMAREHRIISALAPTDVPVAPVVGLCEDDDVNGAPFYVMDFVEGSIVRDLPAVERFTLEQRRATGDSLVDVLARIHAIDVDEVGLDGLGRRDGYLERQLRRWHRQVTEGSTRELPVILEVHERLAATMPEQTRTTIVHGDYRLDNCMLADDGTIAAVLDWELCTLGDPLADLGLLMVYWTEAGDASAVLGSATTAEGYPTRAELLDAYADRSGRDLTAIDYYVAFGYWKLACILEGVYARYTGGSMGTRDEGGFEAFGDQVNALAEAARDRLDGT
jgi:aminoglycoside phosphotransferase (APT) family kinase protein